MNLYNCVTENKNNNNKKEVEVKKRERSDDKHCNAQQGMCAKNAAKGKDFSPPL